MMKLVLCVLFMFMSTFFVMAIIFGIILVIDARGDDDQG